MALALGPFLTHPYFMADVLRRTPEHLGTATIFFIGAASVLSPIVGSLADRHGPRRVAAVGGALAAVGMLTMLTLGTREHLFDLAWRMAAIGVGTALFNSPNMSAILAAAPAGQAGTAEGIGSIARTLGGDGLASFRGGALTLADLALAGVLAQLAARR